MTINAKFKAQVNGQLEEIFFATGTDNVVFLDNGVSKTLTTKLAEIIADVADVPSTSEMNTAVTAAVAALVDGAPESLDTLKELADEITSNDTAMELLNTAIGGKVDKVDGKSLVADTLIAILSNITSTQITGWDTAATNSHSHSNKTVLDDITSSKVTNWDTAEANVLEAVKVNGTAQTITDKAVDLSVPVITVGTEAPDNMQAGDLFLEIVSE